ncbi:MGDG synthase family glycosyltransferase [Sulfuriroseicoccus oceanibius]|uniref:Diacylglycerol glucosyltransferase N-terminal domain-containing protein n=1 Tax=Sulfuriroseicoccus oceanibius TaxID=2707525 RepID=A0A6B3L129_9BACT|nr:hypothetical protein [Sulfuriroseicoccus oceanibius]QQL44145.1 hypothetical protein G3M56_009580 [Sulfuriroseicoccus oceanibius]
MQTSATPCPSPAPAGSGRRILVLTAGFGEGHNAAARAIVAALEAEAPGCKVQMLDPLHEGRPRINKLVKKLYLLTIHRTPKLWKQMYTLSDRTSDVSRDPLMVLRRPKKMIEQAIRDFHPDTIISTYPLYPFMLRRAGLYREHADNRFKLITVVTDSVTINSVWTKGPADSFVVTDPLTAKHVETAGVDPARIHPFGFPVHPSIAEAVATQSPEHDAAPSPFKIALFPTGSRTQACALVEQLAAIPASINWRATLVMGKHEPTLREPIEEQMRLSGISNRVDLLGWTNQVPEILASHHLLCGKAGGATVHEARAAACPMLIHYVVPGQEEGNAILLESEGGGSCLNESTKLSDAIVSLAANDFELWHKQRAALKKVAKPDAARNIARWLVQ